MSELTRRARRGLEAVASLVCGFLVGCVGALRAACELLELAGVQAPDRAEPRQRPERAAGDQLHLVVEARQLRIAQVVLARFDGLHVALGDRSLDVAGLPLAPRFGLERREPRQER